MTKPPPSGPSSDIEGTDRGMRAGIPDRDLSKGSAKEKQDAELQSKGRPKQSSGKPGGD